MMLELSRDYLLHIREKMDKLGLKGALGLASHLQISRNTARKVLNLDENLESTKLQESIVRKISIGLDIKISDLVESQNERDIEKILIEATAKALEKEDSVLNIDILTVCKYLTESVDQTAIFREYGGRDGNLDVILWKIIEQCIDEVNKHFFIECSKLPPFHNSSQWYDFIESLFMRWAKEYHQLTVDHKYKHFLKITYYLASKYKNTGYRIGARQLDMLNNLIEFFDDSRFDYIFERLRTSPSLDKKEKESIVISLLVGPFLANRFWMDTFLAPDIYNIENLVRVLLYGIAPITRARVVYLCGELSKEQDELRAALKESIISKLNDENKNLLIKELLNESENKRELLEYIFHIADR